ncbi:MAG TPA: nucleotidyltransferase [Lachnospiraceae bacterium]|nr:nucleotidyltransferase [Lachnospiraceae bacterium]
MKKSALVILAAGIGSRFGGGIKQLEPVGPNGEIIMDYSIYDAIEAGFDKVVFIIRRDLDEDFRRIIGDRISKVVEVEYAYQEIDDLPEGFSVPEGRKKPWGTGQAVLSAKDVIHEPFAVINADDYYGKEGFKLLHEVLTAEDDPSDGPEKIYMAGFVLRNTLSDNGGVTRGICRQDENGDLIGIDETKNIVRNGDGAAVETEQGLIEVNPDSLVSMNMWGFSEKFVDNLKEGFPVFLKSIEGNELKAEYLLPIIVDGMLNEGKAVVKVLKSNDQWFGVTYREDKDYVKESFAKLVEAGIYESPLFS